MITTRPVCPDAASRSESVTSSSSAGVIAFSTSGRLRVRVRTPSATDWSSSGAVVGVASAVTLRRPLRRRAAELAQPLVRVDPGVVPVRPDGVQAVRADQRDVGQLVFTGVQDRVGAEPTAIPGLAFARCAGAGAPEHGEGNVVRGAVGPLNEERSLLLVVVEAHG